jgi:hypothetical protein
MIRSPPPPPLLMHRWLRVNEGTGIASAMPSRRRGIYRPRCSGERYPERGGEHHRTTQATATTTTPGPAQARSEPARHGRVPCRSRGVAESREREHLNRNEHSANDRASIVATGRMQGAPDGGSSAPGSRRVKRDRAPTGLDRRALRRLWIVGRSERRSAFQRSVQSRPERPDVARPSEIERRGLVDTRRAVGPVQPPGGA